MWKVRFSKVFAVQILSRRIILVICILLCCVIPVRAEESYTFDVAEIEKKPYSFGGYVELRPVLYVLDKDAALYQLQYYKDQRSNLMEWNGRVQLEGSYEKGISRVYVKTNTDLSYSSFADGNERSAFYEGYGTLKPSPSWKVEAGKKNLKWGKGYAWNPVNFLDRVKDPNDPDLSLEGNIMVTADYVRSFDGPLKTLAITPVLFPVYNHINDDFGINNRLNVAAKIYLLLYDTDLDFICAADGSRTARYGMDFSRNLTPNFEMHGELAYIEGHQKRALDADGMVRATTENALSGLIGMRHLTTFDLTTILEYYHNGTGFSPDDMENYFRFIRSGYQLYQTTGNDGKLAAAQKLGEGGYSRAGPMKDYLYLRLSQKEPWDILYFTPALMVMVNLNDWSHSITPELLYTGITNLELRFRMGFIRGSRNTEYGEKPNDNRFELRVGYYF